MAEVYKNYLAGKWQGADSGQTFDSINPADQRQVLGSFPRSQAADVDKAVAAAKAAFPFWSKLPAPKRAEMMFEAGRLMMARKEELGRLMTQEMGKILRESLGDVQEGIDMTFYIAGEGRRLVGETTPSELPDKFACSIRVPLGVVAAITPWNFPFAIPTWKIVPALVAGNTVVFKPAEDTPLLAAKLVEIFIEAGVPEGVLNLVHGLGEEAGAALVAHPDVALVSFTGSCQVGREIAIKCAQDYKRVSLEMGGKNAIIVMEDADIPLAVEGALWGAFGTSGQRCTAASRLFVQRPIFDRFLQMLLERAEKLKVGDGLDRSTDMGPIINQAQLDKVHSYTEIGKQEGAKLLTGGHLLKDGNYAHGFFYAPTIFVNVSATMRIAQEEIFGPTVCLIPFESLDEAIDYVNSIKYGLSSAIFTRNINDAFKAIRDISAGITYVNSSTIGAEVHLPFGGVRQTGNGHREGSSAVLDVFTEWKTVYVDYSGRLQKAQIRD